MAGSPRKVTGMSLPGSTSADHRRALYVFAVALAVRLLLTVWSHSSLYVESPTGMSSLYFRQGYAMAAGLGYVVGMDEAGAFLESIQERVNARSLVATPLAVGTAPPGLYADTLHPPGMPILVGAAHRLFGMPADLPVQILGAVLDSTAAVLVYWIGVTLAGFTAGLAAGLLYAAFLPQAWAATGALMPDGLIGPFIVAMMAAYLKALHAEGRARYAWFALAGLALGLGSYLRPDYLLAPVAMFPFLWLCLRRFVPSALGTLAVLAVAFAVLSPWAYRNHLAYDRWIFASSSPGATMVSGLAAFHNPWGLGPSDLDRHREAAEQGYVSAWLPEADRYFRQLWWDAVRARPDAFLGIVVRRLPLALAPPFQFGFKNPAKTHTFTEFRSLGQDRYDVLRQNPGYVLAAYWDTLIMALVSGVALVASLAWALLEPGRRTLILLLLALHVYGIGSHLIVHFEPRFVLPSVYALLIGLGYVLTRMGNYISISRRMAAP